MMVDITVKKFKTEKPHSELPNILEYGTTKTGLQTTKLQKMASRKIVRK